MTIGIQDIHPLTVCLYIGPGHLDGPRYLDYRDLVFLPSAAEERHGKVSRRGS